jgi:hypothetical protein
MRNSFVVYFHTILCCVNIGACGDLTSLNDEIVFDVNDDFIHEMKLNQVGLGLGSGHSPSANLDVQGNVIISQKLFLGSNTGSSNLNLSGSMSFSSLTVTGNTTLDDEDPSYIIADRSGQDIHVELPYAANVTGRKLDIVGASADHALFISSPGHDIDDLGVIESEAGEMASFSFLSSGDRWWLFGSKNPAQTLGADNLVGWWTFNESAGNTVYDRSQSTLNGVLFDGVTFSVNGIASPLGRSLNLWSTLHRVKVENAAALMSNHISLCVWFDSGSYHGTPKILELDGSGDPHGSFFIRYEGDHKFGFWAYESTGGNNQWFPRAESTTVSVVGQRYHVVGTYDGAFMRIYVNGSLEHAAQRSQPISYGTSGNLIMRIGEGGSLDDVRVYNRVLSDKEVQLLHASGL